MSRRFQPAPPPNDADATGDDFATLFDFLPIGAYRSSPQGQQLRANPALVRLNGFATEAEQLVAVQDIANAWYVNPQRRAQFQVLMEQDGQVRAFESEVYRYKTRDRIWISENAHVVRDAQGAVRWYEGTVEEVTDRVRARQELQRSREDLQQIVELVPGMVFRMLVLPDGRRQATFISAGVRALFGLEPAAVLQDLTQLHRLTHEDDVSRLDTLSRQAALEARPMRVEYRIRLPGGAVRWVESVSAAAPSEDGHPSRVGVSIDVTARKETELALEANSELWKRALESSGDGVWDWHVQQGVEIFSPQCRALYGYTHEELPDRPGAMDAFTHPDDVARMQADREAHFAGRTPTYVNEHRVRCKDGQWRWILSRGIVISRDATGAPLRMIGTHTDITVAKQAEALRVERDRAAAADLAKSQFLSRVSHELRTPLNAILGFAQLLELEPGAGDKQLGWTRHVLTSGRHLLALMDDILDLSSVQTGHLAMTLEPVPLCAALAEAWTMLAATAQAQQITLIDALQGSDAAAAVNADPRRLKQVLSNLLSNAVKYNRPGGWVRVMTQRQGEQVAIAVSDSGPGLTEAQQARLFRPFDRLGAERGPVAGTGLGLSLARQLTESMGGSIEVISRPGEGATFTLWLPAA